MNVITTTIISLLNNILPNYISFGNINNCFKY